MAETNSPGDQPAHDWDRYYTQLNQDLEALAATSDEDLLNTTALVEYYTGPANWYLAWWLHELDPSTQIVTIGGYLSEELEKLGPDDDCWPAYFWNHVGVQIGSGPRPDFLDIAGRRSCDDAMEEVLDGEEGEDHGTYPAETPEMLVALGNPSRMSPVATTLTRRVAEAILAREALRRDPAAGN